MASETRVGDSIYLEGKTQGQTLGLESRYVKFDSGLMKQTQITFLGGTPVNSEDVYVDEQEVLTPEVAGLIVAMCDSLGGTQETLQLPVGTTLTCKIDSQSLHQIPGSLYRVLELLGNRVWIGPFPVLGIAQFEIGNDLIVIQKYHWN